MDFYRRSWRCVAGDIDTPGHTDQTSFTDLINVSALRWQTQVRNLEAAGQPWQNQLLYGRVRAIPLLSGE